jgi:hypothetical protein
MSTQDVSLIVSHCKKVIDFSVLNLSDSYYYHSLPLCVLDAVFSIGVRYEGVENVVARYAAFAKIQRFRGRSQAFPPQSSQHRISDFCELYRSSGEELMTNNVFNRQRTSTKNGILKSAASYRFALALQSLNIETYQDLESFASVEVGLEELRSKVIQIPGQKSGISFSYFLMLSGDDQSIKPDRRVFKFISDAVGREINSPSVATRLMLAATNCLKEDIPDLTPRLLDHKVWLYQRTLQRDRTGSSGHPSGTRDQS